MPATPFIVTSENAGFTEIFFLNPDSPIPVHNYLKRDGQYLSKTIGVTGGGGQEFFHDYQTRSGQQVTYEGVAVDADGQESAPSAPWTATINLSSAWLHHVKRGATSNIGELGAIELFNLEGQTTTQKRET